MRCLWRLLASLWKLLICGCSNVSFSKTKLAPQEAQRLPRDFWSHSSCLQRWTEEGACWRWREPCLSPGCSNEMPLWHPPVISGLLAAAGLKKDAAQRRSCLGQESMWICSLVSLERQHIFKVIKGLFTIDIWLYAPMNRNLPKVLTNDFH